MNVDVEQVPAERFARLLRLACEEEIEVPVRDGGLRHSTSRNHLERLYAEEYRVSDRTATRHFSLVLSAATVPVSVADRVASFLGVPFAYLEATS